MSRIVDEIQIQNFKNSENVTNFIQITIQSCYALTNINFENQRNIRINSDLLQFE